MKYFIEQLIGLFRKSWWLKISTVAPSCEYYFGPFGSENEALQEQPGYLEDIEQEGSQVLKVLVTHQKTPAQLTVEYPQAG